MNLSNVYPCPVDALESAEVAELREELAPFHALDEDITETRERNDGDSDEVAERSGSVSAMEEEEDLDDPVSNSFRLVSVKRDSLSEHDFVADRVNDRIEPEGATCVSSSTQHLSFASLLFHFQPMQQVSSFIFHLSIFPSCAIFFRVPSFPPSTLCLLPCV
jgi:hypothetical protein